MRVYRIMVPDGDGWKLGFRERASKVGMERTRGRDKSPYIYHSSQAVEMAAEAIRKAGTHKDIRIEYSDADWKLYETERNE